MPITGSEDNKFLLQLNFFKKMFLILMGNAVAPISTRRIKSYTDTTKGEEGEEFFKDVGSWGYSFSRHWKTTS